MIGHTRGKKKSVPLPAPADHQTPIPPGREEAYPLQMEIEEKRRQLHAHFFPFLPTGRLPSHLRELPADHWMLNEFLPGGGIYGIWMACDHFHGENDQTGEGALRMVLKAVL